MDLDPKDTHGDFVEALTVAVGSCGVLLVVIGEKWASVSYGPQLRKLDYPNDYVRLEIEIGLQRGIPIVPVLVEGATMPMEEELPFALSRLARHGAIELSDDTWNYDMERLIAHLERTRPA